MFKWIRLILGVLLSITAFWYWATLNYPLELFTIIPALVLIYGLTLISFGFFYPLFSEQRKLPKIATGLALFCVAAVIGVFTLDEKGITSFNIEIYSLVFLAFMFVLSFILHIIDLLKNRK